LLKDLAKKIKDGSLEKSKNYSLFIASRKQLGLSFSIVPAGFVAKPKSRSIRER
jgi:hypothetical protein